MIVPYINNATNPNDPIEKYLISLDEEMTTILNRKDISPQEKLSLYNQALSKYLAYSQNDNIHNRITARSNDHDKFSIKKLITQIKPEIKQEVSEEIKKVSDGIKKEVDDKIAKEKSNIIKKIKVVKKNTAKPNKSNRNQSFQSINKVDNLSNNLPQSSKINMPLNNVDDLVSDDEDETETKKGVVTRRAIILNPSKLTKLVDGNNTEMFIRGSVGLNKKQPANQVAKGLIFKSNNWIVNKNFYR